MLTRKLNDALASIPALDQPYIIKHVRPFVALSSPLYLFAGCDIPNGGCVGQSGYESS